MEVVVEDGIARGVFVEGAQHPQADQDPADGIARLPPGYHDSRHSERQQGQENIPSIGDVAGRVGQRHVHDSQHERQRAQDDCCPGRLRAEQAAALRRRRCLPACWRRLIHESHGRPGPFRERYRSARNP